MRRSFFALTALALAACSGPGGSAAWVPGPQSASALGDAASQTHAAMRVTIPKRRSGHAAVRHPNTISPLTQSFSVSVNGGNAQIFNATPGSPSCQTQPSGLVCTFTVKLSYGDDTFLVRTYSKPDAGGAILDQATATIPITKTTTSVAITLGPVFSTTADSGAGSLRQAVLDANPGDTIVYVGTTPATVTFATPIQLTKQVTIAGPGAAAMTFDGHQTTQLFIVGTSTQVAISGVTITNGFASPNSGGAISNLGQLTLLADVFTNNVSNGSVPLAQHRPEEFMRTESIPISAAYRKHHAKVRAHARKHLVVPAMPHPHYDYSTGNGGAIYDGVCSECTQPSLTIRNSTFSGNAASAGGYDGGAIYNSFGDQLTVSDSTFTNNTASYGGAIESDGNATFVNDVFHGNSALPSAASYVYGSGGALHADGVTLVTGCTFSDNVADGNDASDRRGFGGAISSSGADAKITIASTTFTGNIAGGKSPVDSKAFGGALWVNYEYVRPVTLTGDTFTGNKAESTTTEAYGGAMDGADDYTGGDDSIVGSDDTFVDNAAIVSGSDADAYGGAIETDSVTLKNSTFTGNVSSSPNGYSDGGAIDVDHTLTLTNVTFNKNTTTAEWSASGGAVAAYGSSSADVLTNVTFANNTANVLGVEASADGGGLYDDTPTTIANGTFTGNTASAKMSGGEGYGGALESGATMSFRGTVSSNIAATSGGGILAFESLSIDRSTIASNQAHGLTATAETGGGGIYTDGSGLILSNSTVALNAASVPATAGSGGGGLYVATAATIVNSTIAGNSSTADGGGIFNKSTYGVYSGPLVLNATIYGNTAVGSGANLKNYGTQSALTLQNSILWNGFVSNDGTLTSADYNVIDPADVFGNGLTGMTTHNINQNPSLLPLASNGGPTQTMADQTNSPGYNDIPLAICTGATPPVTTDQRGQPRGDNADGKCDVGAYELQSTVPKL